MKVIRLQYAAAPQQVLELLALPAEARASARFGTARIARGESVPEHGYTRHDQHEISLILKGALDVESGGEPGRVTAGDISIIPAGEAHRARATEDTELLWVFFGATPDSDEAETLA